MNPTSTLNYLKKPFKKFSNLKLSKKSKNAEEHSDISIDGKDLFSDDLTFHPGLTSFNGDIDAVVSQYFNQAKDYDLYDDMRDTNDCRFTTFKTPALPKKTLNSNSQMTTISNNPNSVGSTSDISGHKDNHHLDVKFQLNTTESEIEANSMVETEQNATDFQALDNPLYLSLNECSTGSEENIDHLYENASTPESGDDDDDDDDDHIYENVETQFNLYDTVSNPPRPKLPPKPGHNNNQDKGFGTVKKKKKNSFAARDNKSKDHRQLKLRKSQSFSIMTQRQEEKLLVRDGSETSDLGSSGYEDTTSEEDWPLPPVPTASDIVSADIPFPPPPLELALQQLEDDVCLSEREEKELNNVLVNEPPAPICDVELESKLINSVYEIKENNSDSSAGRQKINLEKENELIGKDDGILRLQMTSEESLRKKHWKSKISTISKGLNVYNEIAENNKNQELINNFELDLPLEENNQFGVAELPSIRHSVVIELKDSTTSSVSSSAANLADSTHNRKEDIQDTSVLGEPYLSSLNSADIGSVCLQIIQDSLPKNENNSEYLKEELFSDQIIEISDDGSWEMRETVDTSCLALVDESTNIDPFTGHPIMTCANTGTSFIEIPRFPIVKVAKQPGAYFESNKSNLACSIIFEDKEDVYSAACVTTFSGASSLSSTVTESFVGQNLDTQHSYEEVEVPACDDSFTTSNKGNIFNVAPVQCKDKPAIPPVKEIAPQLPSVNIGAAIMAEYEKDLQRKKEHLNLPEVSLLEFGDSVKDLEIQRRDVIQQMTVKAKRKDSWIRNFRSSKQTDPSVSHDTRSGGEQVGCDLDQTQISISPNKRPSEKDNCRNVRQEKINHVSNVPEENNVTEELKIKNLDSKRKKLIDIDKLIANAMLPIFTDTPKVKETEHNKDRNAVELMNKKNKTTIGENFDGEFLGKCLKNNSRKPQDNIQIEGEVDDRSILEKKAETRSYWESKMLAAVDDGGWEPVANVHFQSEPVANAEDVSASSVPPPPEFSADIDLPNEGSLSSTEDSLEDFTLNEKECVRPTRQYMFGVDQEIQAKIETCHIVTRSKKPSSQENVIEAEIREQQLREEALRRETDIRSRDKSGGASSPSSHTSDEGFVDRSPEEIPSPPSPSSSHGGYTHTLRGSNGDPIIYDAVSPPSQFFTEKNSANEGDSETKIALEIRELKEREAELRAMRVMREKEQALTSLKGGNALRQEVDLDEFVDENGSPKGLLDDHLISLTTTTDEGNFSEYGETNSSEDKSSDGSNSRIMSPDFQSYGSHADIRQRKPGTVKPFEDDDNDEQPVYTRMKKESVIEREIRSAREREEAYRREKGLVPIDAPSKTIRQKSSLNPVITNGHTTPAEGEIPVQRELSSLQETTVEQPLKRGVQHRIATNRIQQEIEETAQRERELRNTGQIRTLSEETVDSKVTRLADLAIEQNNLIKEKTCRLTSTTSSSSLSSSVASSSGFNNTLPNNRRAPSPGIPATSFTQSAFSNSSFSSSSKLTRSLSTNNLSVGCGGSGGNNTGMRAPQKGLMEKFFASRGKLTGTAFLPHVSSTATLPLPAKISSPSVTTNGVHTRPMKVMPKAAVIRRDVHSKDEVEAPKIYRRNHTTAEEKIQEELREMKQREEELRRLRARTLGRSNPNLAAIGDTEDEDEFSAADCVDASPLIHEVNGELRSASSVSNILAEENEPSQQVQVPDKTIRRRSALIAQWEGRIQQTADT